MASVLRIEGSVITGDGLKSQHQGETDVCFAVGTVVTPTAWDYVRAAGLRVVDAVPVENSAADGTSAADDAGESSGSVASSPAPLEAEQTVPSTPVIPQVAPAQMVCAARCDHPDQAYGCSGDEFGSGFAEPADTASEESTAGCGASLGDDEVEALIQQITDLVMAELAKG